MPTRAALLLCYLIILLTHLYYPKWAQGGPEATISYDVSGYYLYLPAIFIYDDLERVEFLPEIIEKYQPTAAPYQAFDYENDTRVLKYSAGQAVQYAPWFFIAHAWASASDTYPADGFSRPYQLMLSVGSLAWAYLGLFVLCVFLRRYFKEWPIALMLLLLTLGTNYLNYTAIDGAMTHNSVFLCYACLLLLTDNFYRSPTLFRALGIGLLIGLMALTRPTELLAAIIPILWKLDLSKKQDYLDRLSFLGNHYGKVLGAVAGAGLVGFTQLAYWKYASGDWLVYSYQEQGFSFLAPHIMEGLFSFKAGWLIYTPMGLFMLIGFIPLFRHHRGLFFTTLVHATLFIYVAFAWDVWWYGGSLGQRTMVQAYAVLAVPFTAFMSWGLGCRRLGDWGVRGLDVGAPQTPNPPNPQRLSPQPPKPLIILAALAALAFTLHNLYFTHQAHRGGLFVSEQMTKAYFWKTLYRFERQPEDLLRLDSPDWYIGTPTLGDTIYYNDLELKSTEACGMGPISGSGSWCLINGEQNVPEQWFDADLEEGDWIRAFVDVKIDAVRSNRHNSAQMILHFYREGEEVRRLLIRMHRVLNDDWRRTIWMDGRTPRGGADAMAISFYNGGSSQPALVIDNLVVRRLE